ncbi:acyl carrier protein [Candidatus Parcubacteria bacterium]|nr:MAG: acyl carrier protein [Candidatus Parcubacteria bacterium]
MGYTDTLEQYLLREFLVEQGRNTIGPDEDLVELGIVDSLGILRLIAFMEEQFGISIPPEKVVPENFNSISALSALVEQLKGQPSSAA